MKLFVNDISVIDCSLLSKKEGIVGESWSVDIELIGELNTDGMLFDFADVKGQIKKVLDDLIDHRLLVPTKSDFVSIIKEADSVNLQAETVVGVILIESPSQGFCFIDTDVIDTASVTVYAESVLAKVLPDNIVSVSVNLRADRERAHCRYSHGLKKHKGNCQRIAHGHRSILEITEPCETGLEKQWLNLLDGKYIANRADVIDHGNDRLTIGYKAKQGQFRLEMPEILVYVIDADPTVENIVYHIANKIKQQSKISGLLVKMYEGVGKGAMIKI